MNAMRLALVVMLSGLFLGGCGNETPTPADGKKVVKPLVFWHTQAQRNLKLLQAIVERVVY